MKFVLALLLAGSTLIATPISSVKLVSAGHPLVGDGVNFVGPYSLNVGGVNLLALCIDYKDDSAVGDRWNAYVSPIGGNLSYTYRPLGLTIYEEEAYLYSSILRPGADRVGIQHAAWALTDSSYAEDSDSAGWISQAASHTQALKHWNFEVISEVPHAGARQQEFLIGTPVPEPALLHLFVALAAIGLALLGRKRG